MNACKIMAVVAIPALIPFLAISVHVRMIKPLVQIITLASVCYDLGSKVNLIDNKFRSLAFTINKYKLVTIKCNASLRF